LIGYILFSKSILQLKIAIRPNVNKRSHAGVLSVWNTQNARTTIISSNQIEHSSVCFL